MFNRRKIRWPTVIDALPTGTRSWAIGAAMTPLLVGMIGATGPTPPSDSGLAGCTALSSSRQLSASDYQTIGAKFAGSRWPDLRFSGMAYAEMATVLLENRHLYGGETVWFYERVADACAKHGRPLPFWPPSP